MLASKALAAAVSQEPVYVEDVFSTYLIKPAADFTTYSINNGIDLLGEGGMTWFNARDAAQNNLVYDTVRGSSSGNANALITNGTQAQQTTFFDFVTPNANGFTVNFASGGGQLTNSGINYASWTFRDQPKFKAQLTYTGNGGTLSVSHALGSKPGCIIIKKTSGAGDWLVITRKSDGNIYAMYLNSTAAAFYDGSEGSLWTSTSVSINWINSNVAGGFNDSGASYVMYVLAHNAGGFGLTGTDNVISCGSWTENGTVQDINLGFEPQFLLVKNVSSASNWFMFDNMRGWPTSGTPCPKLSPNTTESEINLGGFVHPTATGFKASPYDGSGQQQIYIAIRRGPMKVPTSGTSVYNGTTGIAGGTKVTTGFPVDMQLLKDGVSSTVSIRVVSRLTGVDTTDNNSDFQQAKFLLTAATDAEGSSGTITNAWDNTGFKVAPAYATATMQWSFGRAPGFFDEVVFVAPPYNTTGTFSHELGVEPELIITKSRVISDPWSVYAKPIGSSVGLRLNASLAAASDADTYRIRATPTASTFSYFSPYTGMQESTVAYLFATCPGVSKCGSYTGTGTTQQINCGFAAGARFVLIKRTDSTGDWYVWDTARGIVAGNDPYILLNSTAAEVTSTDYIDSYSAGFEISSTAPAAINANGGTFIFIAIA